MTQFSAATRCLMVIGAVMAVACKGMSPNAQLTPQQTREIQTEIEQRLRDAYDLSKPDVENRMLSLYPKSGRVISATGGRVLSSRDSLAMGIRYFWENVGRNMRQPKWVWEHFYVDVLSPTAAVVTATYRIPHLNPHNQPHELGGAMTMAFEKRGGQWTIVQEHLSDLPQIVDTATTDMPAHEHH
jgi:hypothetical protein